MRLISYKNFVALVFVIILGFCSNLWAKCSSKPVFHPTSGAYLQCIVILDEVQKTLDSTHLVTTDECESFCDNLDEKQKIFDTVPFSKEECETSTVLGQSVPSLVVHLRKVTECVHEESKSDSKRDQNKL